MHILADIHKSSSHHPGTMLQLLYYNVSDFEVLTVKEIYCDY